MTEVLLQELSNSDIDWLIATGQQEEVPSGEVLIQQGQPIEALYVVLEGELTVALPQAENDLLATAFAALEGRETSEREIGRLGRGEVVGEACCWSERPATTTVRARSNALVLGIAQAVLAAKLQQDVSFAAHFYRAIAMLLSKRQRELVSQFGYSRFAQSSPLREVLFVFGELSDSDIDWLIATGYREEIPAGTVLIHEGRPVEGLYILLGGAMTVSVSEEERNPLAVVFTAMEDGAPPEREIARLLRGDMVGEMPFVDDRPPATTVKTFEDSLVLMIPRQQLAVKLQQDVVFASHFYRVVSMLLSNRVQDLVGRLGYGRRVYDNSQELGAAHYEDEIESQLLDRVALAGARFDWMLQSLRVRNSHNP